MFDSIRDKFQSFQENISTTLRGFSTLDSQRNLLPRQNTTLNFNAGTDVLEKFQSSWCELHEISQNNATRAQEVDNLIHSLTKTVKKQSKSIGDLTNILSGLPDIINSLNDLCNQAISLKDLFSSVEKSLIELEDVIDRREFQSRQLDHRFQLIINQERRFAILANLELSLKENYNDKLKDYEMKKELLAKECREAAEKNFKEDIKVYKETSNIPKIELEKSKSSAVNIASNLLEDITLDAEDSKTLDEFLNDESNLSLDGKI